jgi:hypothetical protein
VTGATWSLPSLQTDSVNRGCCISLLTLAMVVLAGLIEFSASSYPEIFARISRRIWSQQFGAFESLNKPHGELK